MPHSAVFERLVMGEAYDRMGQFLSAAEAESKAAVLKKLEDRHGKDAAEIRIRSLENQVAGCASNTPTTQGYSPCETTPVTTLDRRIERVIEGLRRQSSESSGLYYQANQLQAFLDCLPRHLPEAAVEGLRIILDRAGF